MSGLKQKREQLVRQFRQMNREQIKAGLRTIAMNRLYGSGTPLVSTVLQKFIDLNHYQLMLHADQIIDVLNLTHFQELQDQQHDEIVTDLFYLLHQKIIGYPFFIRFKKNQSPYTASLVAYLSADIEAEEIVYWFRYMCEQDKLLVITMIEGETCQRKWVTNKQLFICLLQSLKWFSEAALVYQSILLNCDQLKKKHIDQSVKYIVQALAYTHISQNQQLRLAVVGLLINILQAYYQIKENSEKVMELSNLLKKQLAQNIEIFANPDILADINKIYDVQQNNFLGNEENCVLILNYVSNRLTNNQLSFKNEELQYYLNNLFRLYYNHWRSLHLNNKDYRYCGKVKEGIERLGSLARNNVWLIKLKNIMI